MAPVLPVAPVAPTPLITTALENSDAAIVSVVVLLTALACITHRYCPAGTLGAV